MFDKDVSKIYGTYTGFLEFDGKRYWDIREVTPFSYKPFYMLPSDSQNRLDLIELSKGNLNQAQIFKDELENLQRTDRKLREDYAKISKKATK